MRILRVKIEGLDLFSEPFDYNLVTTQRVTDNNMDSTTKLFNRIYINNVVALIGKNASGKTMELNLFEFANRVFLNNEPLNHVTGKGALIGSKFTFTTYFYEEKEKKLYMVVSVIKKNNDDRKGLSFETETIFSKSITQQTNKNNLFDFSMTKSNHVEKDARPEELLLADDNTYFRKITKRKDLTPDIAPIYDYLPFNNINTLISPLLNQGKLATLQNSIIEYLDPTIEFVHAKSENIKDGDFLVELKFKKNKQSIITNDSDISNYLSSGTIKGLNLFTLAFATLQSGGTFIIDEIENHFHRAIVQTLISFFKDPDINKNRASLLFTTHYPQLLDQFARNDNIYFSTKQDGLIKLARFSDRIKRDDIKKSDIYESDFLGGTSPSYKAYDALRTKVTHLTQNDESGK